MALPASKPEKEGRPKARGSARVTDPKRPAIEVNGEVSIPEWVVDLASFRRWAYSDAFPQHGRFSYLGDQLWVDLTMEELFTHNRVKTRITSVLEDHVERNDLGYFFSDRSYVSNPGADLSSEPDGVFVSYEAVQEGRVQFVEGAQKGYVEIEGVPDMVLEVVSASSVRKDTVHLRDLYFRAGTPEYWLVDARQAPPRFDVLRAGRRGYAATRRRAGWLTSAVFGLAFRLTQQPDPLGHPRYLFSIRGR
jgi:Uma2 family endonuclease